MIKKFLPLAVIATLVSPVASADLLKLQYASFYDHIDQVNEQEYSQLAVRFSFVNPKGETCLVEKANIEAKGFIEEPIVLPTGNYLDIKGDKGLDTNKGIVNVWLDKPNCKISVQVVAKESAKYEFSSEELFTLKEQLNLFMDDMGGMFSFLMPKVQGLVIKFPQEALPVTANYKTPNGTVEALAIKNDKLYLSDEIIAKNGSLSTSVEPEMLSAWMK